MASTTSQLTVSEAIDIVKQHQHGQIDPGVTSFLAGRAHEIWQRIQAQPLDYVLTREEFAIFTYYRGVFGDDEVVQQAIRRFWGQFPPEPLDDQGHKESKGTLEEIPKLAFPQQSDPTPLPSRQRSPELQSSFKPFIPRLHNNSDKQSLPDESTTSDNDRAAYACGRCRLWKTRCSRQLPACQLCKERKLPCVYMDSSGNKTIEQFLEDMRKSFSEEGDHMAVPLQQDNVQLEDPSHLKDSDAANKIKSLTDVIDVGNGNPKRIGQRPFCQHHDEENSQAQTRNILEARYKETFRKREMAWEGYREPTPSNIPWASRVGKQDGSTPQTWKADPGYLGSPEMPCVTNSHEKSEAFFEDRRKRNQSTISEDSQLTQGEPTPQTPQVDQGHPECPENLSIDWARLLIHVTDGEEYGLVNSIKIWVQSWTRESWDWWPLHPSFQQLQEDEVRIKRYCVSHYPRCMNPGLLKLSKGFRARTLDCAPQERARSFIRSFEE